jgi:hypothetical protein
MPEWLVRNPVIEASKHVCYRIRSPMGVVYIL